MVVWIGRSKRYNDGRITIKVYQPPLVVGNAIEEADITTLNDLIPRSRRSLLNLNQGRPM
jgi:hypothetical protein